MSAASLLGEPAPSDSPVAADPAIPTSGAPSAVVSAQQDAATNAWVDSISDPTVKAYTQAKGWKSPGDVATGYFHLEKLLGGEKVPLPKGDADAEGWNRLYKAAGRPETPEGYKLPAPAAGDKGFVDDAQKVFHAAGLSTKQAQTLATWYNDLGARVAAAEQQKIEARNTAELDAYKREQGQLFDAKIELGSRAAKQFGFTNDELVAFERGFGTKALLTRFAAIGEGLAEHSVVGDGQQGFALSATAASARLAELKKDREFTAKYLNGDADARATMMALQAAAAGMTLEAYQQSMGLQQKK